MMGISIKSGIFVVISISIWALVRLFMYFRSKKKGQNFVFKREVLLNIFFIYLIIMVSLLFFPIDINFGPTDRYYRYGHVNLIPVVETVKMASSGTRGFGGNYMIKFTIKNIVGNILLLMPLAILLPILYKKFRSYRTTILFGMLVSLSIETLQYLESYLGSSSRIIDIDDFILNSIGVVIGFLIYDKIIKNIPTIT